MGRRLRALALTLVTTAIVLVFALAEWATVRFLSERSRIASTAVEIGLVLVAALLFRPLHQRVESSIEAGFHRRKRQALASLDRFRREIGSYSDLRQLLRRVVDAIDDFPDARASAIYLRRESFHAEASSFDDACADVDAEDPLAIRLRSHGAPARPAKLKSTARGTYAFGMMAAGDLVGFIVLECRHGEHDDDELKMMSGVAQDLGVALCALEPSIRPRKAPMPNNIPVDLPTLIGRERELEEIEAALAATGLVTVTGAGGVGKTRVALQCAANAIRRHEHGAWFVGLEPLTDGHLVGTTMIAALGGTAERGSEVENLVEYLRAKDLLLVIDNCEQVLADVAAIVRRVRAECPRVAIIATSRELLRVDGEQVYKLASLRMDSAIELFEKRASAVSPSFDAEGERDAIREICGRLDCIPLAIELAAARVRAISPHEILDRLHERFRILTSGERTALPRRQTLAATIRWSYDLLAPQEQSLFGMLGTFRGSFSLAAAASIADAAVDEFQTLDLLTSLCDKSLLSARLGAVTRYRMLETIREFALAQRDGSGGENDCAAKHAAFFASIASHAYHEFDSRMPPGWLARLEPDLDNFRAALERTLEGPGDRRAGAQLAADCGPMYLRLGLIGEGLHWCETARRVGEVLPATAGRIEYVASMLHNNAVRHADARNCAQVAVERYRASTDERGLIRALSQFAYQCSRLERFDEGRSPADEAIRRARSLGEPRVLAGVLRRCATALPPEEIDRARSLFKEALAVAKQAHDPEESGYVLQWWGVAEAAAGAFDRAMTLASDALASADADTQMYLESDVAGYAMASGDFEKAEPHARRALRLAVAARHAVFAALTIAYCAPLHAICDPEQAARLLGYANARLHELGFDGDRAEKIALTNAMRLIDDSLEGAALSPLLEEGASLSQDEALGILEPPSALGVAERPPVGTGDGVVARLR